MEINEKNLEKVLKKQREEYQRYLGALSEGFESQVKLIAESMIGIQGQLISIKEMIVENTEDLEMIKMDIHIVRNDLKEKIGRDELSVLEKRVAFLEKKISKGINSEF